jgi:hypothetical protein
VRDIEGALGPLPAAGPPGGRGRAGGPGEPSRPPVGALNVREARTVTASLDKVAASPSDAIAGIRSGSSFAVGGFGICGIPSTLIGAIHRAGIDDLRVVSNNCGVDDWGLGILLADKRITRMTA